MPRNPSAGELAVAAQLGKHPGWVAEFRFVPDRRWKFDFANPQLKVAIEIDGGSSEHAHGQVSGREAQNAKRNFAAAIGWRILVFSSRQALEGELIPYLKRITEGRWPDHPY